MKLETKSLAFDVKAGDGDGSTFAGVGGVFFNIDAQMDILDDGAFDADLPSFLSSGVIRDEHMITVGRPTGAERKSDGLHLSAAISDTAAGRDVRTLLKDGVVKGLSIGSYNQGRWLESPEEVAAYWATKGYQPSDQDLVRSARGAFLITRAKLVEVSTTFNPANERARITSVKSAGPRGGLTFDDHSAHTLAVLEEFHGRAKALRDKRAADGRSLSGKHRAAFRRLADDLAALLEAPAPPPAEGDPEVKADANRLYAEFLQLESRLAGVDC